MYTENEILTSALKTFGQSSQLDKTIEECAELIDQLLKWRYHRTTLNNVISEAVDVELCLNQLKIIFNSPELYASYKSLKLDRLKSLLSRYNKV